MGHDPSTRPGCRGACGGSGRGDRLATGTPLKEDALADPYPPIADYGFVADCHSGALVSRTGSVDWCCMPRLDSGSVFGRLLDVERGGYCRIAPTAEARTSRRYLESTLVLETSFVTDDGEVRLLDCFTMHRGGREQPHRQLLRVVEGVRGMVEPGRCLGTSPRP
jgi:GH15 family glucan-1,4-alpha-glucosidase